MQQLTHWKHLYWKKVQHLRRKLYFEHILLEKDGGVERSVSDNWCNGGKTLILSWEALLQGGFALGRCCGRFDCIHLVYMFLVIIIQHTDFLVHCNMHIYMYTYYVIYCLQGILSFLSAPLIGALSDVWGRKPFLLLTVSFTCAPIPLMKVSPM